jgi:hypothetical protein
VSIVDAGRRDDGEHLGDDDVHDVGAAGDVFGQRRSRRGRCGQTVTHGWGF